MHFSSLDLKVLYKEDTSQESRVTSSNNKEDIVDEEEEEEEEEENARKASGGSILPDSQELFLTLEPIPSAERDAVEGTSAEILSVGASSTPGQRLSQIRRRKKKTREDMFSELIMSTSESDKMELSTWRIALSDSLNKDSEDRRACREHERAAQEEMLRIMREQTDMSKHLVEVQERQLDARVPLHPMLNLLPSSPSSTSSSPRHPRMSPEGGKGGPVSVALNSRGGCKVQKAPIPTPLTVTAVRL
ncbi:uncharacterized protein LOC135972956 [Chrysemys picta bellii]|uniref:uncharacterized protein LOC135972956 n=1 Tax=Chrysemys picta bellii TaxID=8478 RepID=UPI0032B17AC9